MKPIPLPMAELKPALLGLSKVTPKRATLPVLGTIKIERTSEGWITLTGTDLEHYATVRLEQPAPGEPACVLIPLDELVKVSKSCGKNDTLAVRGQEEASVTSGIITYPIGGQQVEHRCSSFSVEEFPEIPRIEGKSCPLPDSVRSSIQDAFECASTDTTRYVLNGAYLDVSKPDGHYVVATDGRQLFSSNSFKLDLPESLIIPAHKFIAWKEFNHDGEWLLTLGQKKKDDIPSFHLCSRRWTFISRQIEGNYPNWRQVIPDPKKSTTTVEFEKPEEIIQTIQRLPDHDGVNHTIGIEMKDRKLTLLAKSGGDALWTRVPIETMKMSGKDVLIALNRHCLARALGFGLNTLNITDEMSPVRFSEGGRQLIVMPIRHDCGPQHQQTTSPVSEKTEQGEAESVDSKSANEPAEATPAEAQPPKEETMPRTITPAVPATNGNGTHADTTPQPQKPNLDLALDQIETIKGSYREAIRGLTGLTDTLKQVQRDQKTSEKEVQSVRTTLEKLQSVRL